MQIQMEIKIPTMRNKNTGYGQGIIYRRSDNSQNGERQICNVRRLFPKLLYDIFLFSLVAIRLS